MITSLYTSSQCANKAVDLCHWRCHFVSQHNEASDKCKCYCTVVHFPYRSNTSFGAVWFTAFLDRRLVVFKFWWV